MAVLWLLLIVAAAGAWRYVDVRRHPVRPCPRCDGSKKNAGSRPTAWGTCRRRGGKEEVRRIGAPKSGGDA
jgi:hypothetical protein